MPSENAERAFNSSVVSIMSGHPALCRFLTANDTGLSGGHQAGIFIPKPAWPMLFDEPGEKGANKDRWVTIHWQDGRDTNSRFIYYGVGTRNEYRITNFGRDFPWLDHEQTGSLFVLAEQDPENYSAFVLDTDEDIDFFLDAWGIGTTETGQLLNNVVGRLQLPTLSEDELVAAKARELYAEFQGFPPSPAMAGIARELEDRARDHADWIRLRPDAKLLSWTEMEFNLFRAIENGLYGPMVRQGFSDMESFIGLANQVLNRRKSRAGKSLEHHLEALFSGNGLPYTAQGETEIGKRPDFIFPSIDAYRDPRFDTDRLVFLAVKTTCKDRWRQILDEADRFNGRERHLLTLQPGMSPRQMEQMSRARVRLVVPEPYISAYPPDRRGDILTVADFINQTRARISV